MNPVRLSATMLLEEESFFFFFTLVIGPRRSLSLELSDTRVYEPQIRARLGTASHFCSERVWDEPRALERDDAVGGGVRGGVGRHAAAGQEWT